MERARVFQYLRIAVTVLSLTACVLLVALWVRSYWQLELVYFQLFDPRRRGPERGRIPNGSVDGGLPNDIVTLVTSQSHLQKRLGDHSGLSAWRARTKKRSCS